MDVFLPAVCLCQLNFYTQPWTLEGSRKGLFLLSKAEAKAIKISDFPNCIMSFSHTFLSKTRMGFIVLLAGSIGVASSWIISQLLLCH